tara:strand:- start:7 stop:1230 length:1224 start_codon:yes stop_codon:yes gene_type:complete
MKSLINRVKKINDIDGIITPESIFHIYNISQNGESKTSQAVAEFLNDTCVSSSDLAMFENLTATPSVTVNYTGQCNTSTMEPDVEGSLDIQYQYGVNSHVDQHYLNINDWMYAFAQEIYQLKNPPLVISMSWGWSEADQCDNFGCSISVSSDKYVARTNVEFMKLSLRGITLVASAGDAGSSGRTNEGCDSEPYLNPVFPGGSPYVISVGGTVITNPVILKSSESPICKNSSCIIGGNEHNCDFNLTGWTSGSGFSNFSQREHWQNDAVNSYLQSNTTFPPSDMWNSKGRAYPDVSMVAHAYQVINNGVIISVDGTSASSPSFSALISRLNNLRISENKSAVGLVGPLLYQMWKECTDCFYDLTIGSSNSTEYSDCKYGYNAASGYDAVYGLGLPNFDKMYEYVKNM